MEVNRSYLEALFERSIQRYQLPEPVREYPFRGWWFDFAYPHIKVFIEINGGTYNGGAHIKGKGYERDCWKYGYAQLEGWVVLVADRNMVQKHEFMMLVKRMILKRISERCHGTRN